MGLIEHNEDKKKVSTFIALAKDLEPPGALSQEVTTLNFNFNGVEKQYETYRGSKITVRYILRVSINSSPKQYTQDYEFGVSNPVEESLLKVENNPIRLEVGIEDWLHLLFEIDGSKYHLKDCITGQVIFKKVSIRLKSMELQIIKRETIGAGVTSHTENETIVRYEIMDGGPIKNEILPIRFFISPYKLSPTYPNVNQRLSVQYFINLVLLDVEDRRYFKQSEITLFRI
jgi:vacuolar protein sorting-associated protein 26